MSRERRAPLDGRTVVTLEGGPELWPEGGAEEVELWSGFRIEDRILMASLAFSTWEGENSEAIILLSASHVVKVKGQVWEWSSRTKVTEDLD